jgi:hypothetical protein
MSKLSNGVEVTVPDQESGELLAGKWVVRLVHKYCDSYRTPEWELVFTADPDSKSEKVGSGWVVSGTHVTVHESLEGVEGDGKWIVTRVTKHHCKRLRGRSWELVWHPASKEVATRTSTPRARSNSARSNAGPKAAAARKAPAKKAAPARRPTAKRNQKVA